MTRPEEARTSERLYGLLWRIYPKAFRDQYGRDALELFRDRCREIRRRRGAPGMILLWCRTIPNVLVHGGLERAAALGRTLRELARGPVLTHAVRGLLRTPMFTGTVVLTLAVGIGSSVALFSVLEGVLLEPLPYPEPDRLVRLWELNADVDAEQQGVSPLNFADWETSATGFEAMASWYLTSGTHRTEQVAEEIRAAQVTADFFRVLGVAPALGRDFRREEVDRYGPVMLSHSLWMRLYGGDPSIVGKRVRISSSSYEVVGVMPPGFAFPDESVESWLAWNLPAVYRDRPETRTWRFLGGIARLDAETSRKAADDELSRVAARLAETYPGANRGWTASTTSLRDEIVGGVTPTLWVAFGAALCILLIACANVANMLLARVPGRSRELALRQSLGATRGRIWWELLVEALLIAAAAATLGLALGSGLLELLTTFEAGRIPRVSEVQMSPAVLAFALGVTGLATVAFGLAPAMQALRGSGPRALGAGVRTTDGRRQRRVRETFVGTQVAIALVLLVGASVLTASLRRIIAIDPGFDPHEVMTFRVSLDGGDRSEEEAVRYYDGLIQRIGDLPGVERVGAAQSLPMSLVGNDFRRPYRAVGSAVASGDASTAQMRIVTPDYVDAMRMRLVDGQGLPASAGLGDPLQALVNETLARRLWPNGGAVGQTFEVDFRDGWDAYHVVGVLEDARHYGLREDPEPEIFLSHRQVPYLAMSFAVRVAGRPEAMVSALRSAVLAHRPLQPPHAFVSLDALLDRSVAEERFLSVLLALLAAIGALLAATGVYGVVAYSVSHRRREIGVRMALGAPPERVAGEVLASALKVAGLGVVVGIVCVLSLGGLIEHLVFEGPARDPWTAITVGLGLLTVSALAAFKPAYRAARVAPSDSIRSE